MSDHLTKAEKLKVEAAAVALAKRLTQAFEPPDMPWRNRYILALRGLMDFMKEMECPMEWRQRIFELPQALVDLECGVVPEIFKPVERPRNKSNDELRVWRVRSLAVIAWESRARGKMPTSERLREFNKHHPKLGLAPYVTGRKKKLQTSLPNWKRKLNGVKIKKGDHLDVVVDEYMNLKRDLDQLRPDHAASVADTLLRYALY